MFEPFALVWQFLCNRCSKIIQPGLNTVTRELVGVQGKRTITGSTTCVRACMFHFSFSFFNCFGEGVSIILLAILSCILITYIVIQLGKKNLLNNSGECVSFALEHSSLELQVPHITMQYYVFDLHDNHFQGQMESNLLSCFIFPCQTNVMVII